MQLKVVLLPEPFGPIRPRISPSSTANETSWTARKAPNRFESPDTFSIGMRDPVSVSLSLPRRGRVGERGGVLHFCRCPTRPPSAATLPAARGGIKKRESLRVGVSLREREHR